MSGNLEEITTNFKGKIKAIQVILELESKGRKNILILIDSQVAI